MMAKKNLHWTPEELELCTPSELAELLANIVMVLRRLPDVPLVDLQSQDTSGVWRAHTQSIAESVRNEKQESLAGQSSQELPSWADK